MASPEGSSGDESFRSDVLKAAGISKESIKYRTKVNFKNWTLDGEKSLVEESQIGFMSMVGKITGKVIVTNYRLRFESQDSAKGTKDCVFSIPLCTISHVTKVGYSNVTRGQDSYGLDIYCKDMRNLRFTSKQANHSRRPLFEHLQKYAFPASNKLVHTASHAILRMSLDIMQPFFAFNYTEKFSSSGWEIFDTVAEFKRMGVPNDTWKLTKINDRYEYSETYPSVLSVPTTALSKGDEFLWKMGEFRSKQRIPVLSWLHPESQASLTRASQPLVGMTSRKSAEDEEYLQMIIEANAQSDKLFIFDARPEVNAKVNRAKGGGYENEDCYANCQLVFLDIQNIHVMRESLRKLKEICFPRINEKSWFADLDDIQWLVHIKMIMTGASQIVDKLENRKNSVLVHCSDGWDRTAQLTSLSMLMLDSFYRTLHGFQVLIEKEWCSFGHKFAHRIGHGDDKHGDSERSPIFLQFIDCVWQTTNQVHYSSDTAEDFALLVQFPTAFEFNTSFLIEIVDHLFSCRFGNFLGNSEKQRICELRVRDKTRSLWAYINKERMRFLNPLYNEKTRYDVIIPNCSMRAINLWTDYYLRFNPVVSSHQRMEEQQLTERAIRIRNSLREQVDRLKVEAAKMGKIRHS